ncbi:MAG UNVERIFIED_CONTAM: hypothetical protein LVR29_15860 [Microcystis novacekii LVE1205-3]
MMISDFGTSWLADAIFEIPADYHNTFRVSNPSSAAFSINDVSKPTGGDTLNTQAMKRV